MTKPSPRLPLSSGLRPAPWTTRGNAPARKRPSRLNLSQNLGLNLGLSAALVLACASLNAQTAQTAQTTPTGQVGPTASQARASTAAVVAAADYIVAVVNSEPVTNQEVQAMRQRLLRDLTARGATLPSAQQLTEQALEMLINEKAQLQLAQELGIKVDEEQVEQALANVAANNGLSRQALAQQVQQEGSTMDELTALLRTQLTLSRLREREVESRLRISESDIDQFLREQAQGGGQGGGQGVGQSGAQTLPEIHLAMILVAVPEGSSEAAVQALQAKATDIARRARAGEDFAVLAKTYSQAADKGSNGGQMGLRSIDRYPELFVQAVRQLPLQGIAGPLRSGAGFHILKLLELRQPEPGLQLLQTRARHILLRPSAQLSRDQALAQLQALRGQILAGRTSFERAAQQLSQDGSAEQGGDLGWASPGQFVPEFEQAMDRLQPGQISEPVVTRFGVHLLQVAERRQATVPERERRERVRALLREKRQDETFERWLEEVRGRAYVEMRELPQVLPLPSAQPANAANPATRPAR